MAVKITGYLDYEGASIGERVARVRVQKPYPHEALVLIRGDREEDSDDTINEALEHVWSKLVVIEAEVDGSDDIVTTPSRISLA